ncbi:TPA: hypothetical protein U2L31_007699 [Burkholderia contaminans]|nr:hypothetical protein [Burkholderia contaminans]
MAHLHGVGSLLDYVQAACTADATRQSLPDQLLSLSRLKWTGPCGLDTQHKVAAVQMYHKATPAQPTVSKYELNLTANGGVSMDIEKLQLNLKKLTIGSAVVVSSMNLSALT